MKNLAISVVALLLGVAISSVQNAEPTFQHTNNKIPVSEVWGSNIKAPYATNAFFQNMVVGSGFLPIDVTPYLARIERGSQGLGICWNTKDEVTSGNVTTTFDLDWAITPHSGIFNSHNVVRRDELSVTVKSNFRNGSMTFPLVRGSAFISVIVDSLSPILYTPRGIENVTTANDTEVTKFGSSDKFVVTLNNGDTWVLYLSENAKILRTSNQLRFQGKLSGIIRLAYIGKDESNLPVYEKFKDAVPVSTSLYYFISQPYGYIKFKFNCVSLSGANKTKDALMFALPHHMDSLYQPNVQNVTFKTVMGTYTAIAKNYWYLKEELILTTWQHKGLPFSYNFLELEEKSFVGDFMKETYEKDIEYYTDPELTAEFTVYDLGVQVNRLARLALIGDWLSDLECAEKARDAIKRLLIPWLENTNENLLYYDQVYGGIITDLEVSDWIESSVNSQYDIHHHEYGYLIYAAAVVGKEDSDFLDQYKDQILELVRDYANPYSDDPYFPLTRNKDWFRGHSWSRGLGEYADNRNEESISESINSYYAVSLLGVAMNDERLKNWGSLLAATELRSAKKYWQMPDDSVYPDTFAKNRMVGTLWTTKVDYRTYFGSYVDQIHGLNMLPFSPITSKLLSESFIQKEYPVFSAVKAEGEFLSYQIMAQAVINPKEALARAINEPIHQFGRNSKSNMLWWILTRKAPFTPVPIEIDEQVAIQQAEGKIEITIGSKEK